MSTAPASAPGPASLSAPTGMSASEPPASATAGEDAPARTLRRFRQVITAVRAHFLQVEKQVGIGGAQLWALGVIGDQPGIGVGGLARALHVHQSTASNLVRGLVDRGLVVTTRGEADRRAVELRLLPEGQTLLARAPGPYTGLLSQALQGLDEPTLHRLEVDLATLARRMGIAEDAPAIPIGSM
jgi:DNA-binding MarR family transcriptional regulator